jgi:outer membrane murein-binding lipoprotein Lpp
MPIATTDFIGTCGRFLPVYLNFMLKRSTKKREMRKRVISIKSYAAGVVFGCVLCYLFWGSLLLRAGDIEVNPGPDKQVGDKAAGGPLRQTRLTSAKNSETGGAGAAALTLNDVMAKLMGMDGKLDTVSNEVRDIKSKFDALEQEMGQLRQDCQELSDENDALRQTNKELTDRVDNLEKKVDDLEGRSRRNNVLFYGLDKEENETSADCEARVRELLTDKLELSRDVEFDRVHRVGSKPNSPLIARCVFFKDKVEILKSKSKLQGTNIFIGEDFSMRVRTVRKKLAAIKKDMKTDGQKVTMVYDHLIVNGKKMYLSEDGEGLVPAS